MGFCVAAFALAVLEGSTKPGVWFPEEVSYIFLFVSHSLLSLSLSNSRPCQISHRREEFPSRIGNYFSSEPPKEHSIS